MNFHGIWIGLFAFLIIGLCHPIVIKAEYYFTNKIWSIFLISSVVFFLLSIYVKNTTASSLFGILSFACFWSIKEIRQQKIRVKKSWFQKKPQKTKEGV